MNVKQLSVTSLFLFNYFPFTKVCVSICNAILKSYAKNEENSLLLKTFFLIRILNWNFGWCFAMLLRNLVQNCENLSMKFKVMQTIPANASRNLWDAYIPAGLKGLKQISLKNVIHRLNSFLHKLFQLPVKSFFVG